MQITKTQLTLNTYSCLKWGFDTKNVTLYHNKANDIDLHMKF